MLGMVTLFVGVSVYPDHGQTAAELIQQADRALYQAKVDGRNRIAIVQSASQIFHE
jgi:diguanylate cyclase (GGDEF)-like protein